MTWLHGFLVASISAALVLSACGGPPSGQRAGAQKELTFIQTTELKSFDPRESGLTHEDTVQYQVYDSLARGDDNLVVQPRLAESWKNIAPTTWEVKLRSGVKFTNGEPLNAESVVESFKWLTRPDSKARGNLSRVSAVERVDDLTVHVQTPAPDPRFQESLVKMLAMPAGVLEKDPESLGEKPIGTGPFKLAEWVKGERIVLEANPDSWRGRPKLDRIVYRFVPEAAARVAALQAGQADLIVNVPPESIDLLEKGANTKILAPPSTRGITFIFNSKQPPFNDVRVRQAMNYAVDKDNLIKNILGGKAELQITTSHLANVGNNRDIKPYAYDLQKAKALLTEAGYPNGFETSLYHPSGRWLKDVEVSQTVAGMLEKVGVQSKLSSGEYGTFFTNWTKGDYPGLTMIGSQNNFDAAGALQYFFYTKGGGPGHLYSADPKVDALYEQQAAELDPQKRERILKEIEAYIHDQAYWLFLYFQADIYGASKRVKWTPPKDERVDFFAADFE